MSSCCAVYCLRNRLLTAVFNRDFTVLLSAAAPAEQLTEGASALLELAKKSNATSPVEAQPQQPQKTVYLVRLTDRRVGLALWVQQSSTRQRGAALCAAAAVVAGLPVSDELSI